MADERSHIFPVRVYYEDTDAEGIVYYANYLKFAERARTEVLRDFGMDHRTLRERAGIGIIVKSCEVDYISPARLDDMIEVRTRFTRVGGASLEADQDIVRGESMLARLQVRLACIDISGRPARWPSELRAALAAQDSHR